ncbi:MAG: hypothetical protein WCI56_07530 [Hyphomicrobiales bacterium]
MLAEAFAGLQLTPAVAAEAVEVPVKARPMVSKVASKIMRI